MKDFKVSIYGNLILDSIVEIPDFPVEGVASRSTHIKTSLGACANVARAYNTLTGTKPLVVSRVSSQSRSDFTKRLSKYSNCHLYVTDKESSSSAIILDCKANSTRTGIVSWGSCVEMDNFFDDGSDWKHFCYLDKITNLDDKTLSDMTGVKTADLTSFDYCDKERSRVMDCLSEIDYLITSREEAAYLVNMQDIKDIVKKLGKKCKKGVIIHDPRGSYFSDGRDVKRVEANHDTLDNVSVLGAGDIFAAAFIATYDDSLTVGDCLLKSHNKTYNILKGN